MNTTPPTTTEPRCIIVTGQPGSGKTTLATQLAQRLWMPVLSRDQIKEGYVNTFGVKHDQLPPDTNAVVSGFFFDTIDRFLDARVSVVIEAAFQHKLWANHLPRIAERSRARLILCTLDPILAAQRHLQRGLDDPNREFYHGDKRVQIYRETGEVAPGTYDPPRTDIPTLRVDTTDNYEPGIDDIASFALS